MADKDRIEEKLEDFDDDSDDEHEYFDFGSISRKLMIFGIIILITYILLYSIAFVTADDVTWEGSFVGNVDNFICALPLSFTFLVIGGVLFFIHMGFVDLAEFADEVESGEFEKKALKELEEEDKEKKAKVRKK